MWVRDVLHTAPTHDLREAAEFHREGAGGGPGQALLRSVGEATDGRLLHTMLGSL
jgi:hypothetical protein